jgi:small-conductance mechanosensitive channel
MFAFATLDGGLDIFGIRLVGVTTENVRKLILTVIYVAVIWALNWILRAIAHRWVRGRSGKRIAFWTSQAIHLATALLIIIGLLSIWFNNGTRLATFLGLVTAGLAFAMQRVVTALCGYFVLLGGKTFNVGERIKMGGVRGDVMALGFIQTTIMEMGEPPEAQGGATDVWVQARQYTGRLVTVTNDKIFDEPVYNYSREFPFIWEEMKVGIPYGADCKKAEEILLDAARRHTQPLMHMSERDLKELERRYVLRGSDLEPRVFWRLTDNWVELTVRFICLDYGVRTLKDQMSRDILAAFTANGLEVASGTYQVVGMPELKVRIVGESGPSRQPAGAAENNIHG